LQYARKQAARHDVQNAAGWRRRRCARCRRLFPFAALPPALALKIFAALPVDTRLRCAEVCKAWCAAVAERSLWTRLDLSHTSGVKHRVTPALLRAAAAKARGALAALDVSGVWRPLRRGGVFNGVLREVLAANASTLRELRCLRGHEQGWLSAPVLEALLSAAPQLRVCEADLLISNADEARGALRNEGMFGPLRVRAVESSDAIVACVAVCRRCGARVAGGAATVPRTARRPSSA
jgi:hypothetical protein